MSAPSIPDVVYYHFFQTTFSIQPSCVVTPAKQQPGNLNQYISIPYDSTSSNNSPIISYNSTNYFPLKIYIFQKNSTDYWFIIESQTSDKNNTLYACFTVQISSDTSQSNDLGLLFTAIDQVSAESSTAPSTTTTISKFDLNSVITKQQPEKLDTDTTYVNINGAGTVITVCSTHVLQVYGASGNTMKSLDSKGDLFNASIFSTLFSTGGPILAKSANPTTLAAAAFTQKLSCKAVGTDVASEKGFAIPLTPDKQSTQSITVVIVIMCILGFIKFTFPGLYEMFIFPQNSAALHILYPPNGYNRNMAHVMWSMTFSVLAACLVAAAASTGNTDYMYACVAILGFYTTFIKLFNDYNEEMEQNKNDGVGHRIPDLQLNAHFVNTLYPDVFSSHNIMYIIVFSGMILSIIGAILQFGAGPDQNKPIGSILFLVGICTFPSVLFLFTIGRAMWANMNKEAT